MLQPVHEVLQREEGLVQKLFNFFTFVIDGPENIS
jgi:hypothetical protein